MQTAQRRRTHVSWYGGAKRKVEVVTRTGNWWRGGEGLVPVRWVFVRDLTGTHRDEYFFSTDPRLSAERIVGIYTGRWSIETTFQEMRRSLGLETTRVRTKSSVLRAAPCLFGLYSVVAILFARLPKEQQRPYVEWNGKRSLAFSDAITAVRRWLWGRWILEDPALREAYAEIPHRLRSLMLAGLAPAA